ncbi:PadR family transcriptional regulator [Deinococcus roseus]|uniref:PadR family transcriptional regulator n=1 Tax=Deinococcus roseus TaxID=392414 RepID=A0ABQ2D827_9DEIO|nr:PadR family transcriptional regulator [Deinococcus roseus]GGJ48978.1 PadR family transcriptional regulator [Deinococcus roseus]
MPRAHDTSEPTLRVLHALAAQPDSWHHGYPISKTTGIKSGSLYPILIRLSERGYLESRWEPSEKEGRPARHAYRITASGQQFLREQAVLLQTLQLRLL